MKLTVKLTELEIRHAIAQHYAAKEPLFKGSIWQDVSLQAVEADDDPRSPQGATITATITRDNG